MTTYTESMTSGLLVAAKVWLSLAACVVLAGSIFAIPMLPSVLDGIWGVRTIVN